MRRRGFTLIEMLFALIIFAWLLLIFANISAFSLKFTSSSYRVDALIQNYIANNTFIYKTIQESTQLEVYPNQVRVDDGVFEITGRGFYFNDKKLYSILESSKINYNEGILEIILFIDNTLDQKVEIVIKK